MYSISYSGQIFIDLEFSRNISKNTNIKFHPSVQTDRQTDMTKLIVANRNFANAPKMIDNLSPYSITGTIP